MHYSSIPEKPLVVGAAPQIEKPTKTYFYEVNGRVICAQAGEAWGLHKKYKQIGVSDGTHYAKRLQEAKDILSTEGLASSQKILREAFNEELEISRGHLEVPPNPDRMEFKQR